MSVRGADVNMAVIDREAGTEGYGLAVSEAFSRQSFPGETADPDVLLEFTQRIRQDLRDWNIQGVTLVETTKYSNWVYSQAYQRVLCIAGLMIAAAEEQLAYEVVKPPAVGTYLQSPKVEAIEPIVFGFEAPPKYWTTGAREAYAAAAYCARAQ